MILSSKNFKILPTDSDLKCTDMTCLKNTLFIGFQFQILLIICKVLETFYILNEMDTMIFITQVRKAKLTKFK